MFRLPGSFLLRLAERTWSGLLFHDPPRNTRRSEGPIRLPPQVEQPVAKEGYAQSPRVGVARMRYPGADTPFNGVDFDTAFAPVLTQRAQAAGEAVHIGVVKPPAPVRQQHVAEKGTGDCGPDNARLARMQQ